jgi:hypothetical protein
MRQSLILIGLAIASQIEPARATAQQRPNFSGTWKLEHVASDPRMRTGAGPDYLLGSEITVVQDAGRLVLTKTGPESHPPLTFALDGSESRNTLPGIRGGAPLDWLARLIWERNTLVMETTAPWVIMQRWSLTPSGQLSIQDNAPNIEVGRSTIHLLYGKADEK